MDTTPTESTISTSPLPSPRRKNYNADDDTALLRQVQLDRPFEKARVTGTLSLRRLWRHQLFSCQTQRQERAVAHEPTNTCYSRKDEEAELLSGVSEEVTERDILPDELVELLDDVKRTQEGEINEEQKKRERDEGVSLVARRVAMERLQQSSAEDNTSPLKKRARLEQLSMAMLDMKERDIEARREEERKSAVTACASVLKTEQRRHLFAQMTPSAFSSCSMCSRNVWWI
ncbi:hypothetical protein BBJ28_00022977 [Nothophytophthora sp. Chile5]|nr:hypothetical protein BBJ28_00022977 [Nothophytophthora sp. Chile5]